MTETASSGKGRTSAKEPSDSQQPSTEGAIQKTGAKVKIDAPNEMADRTADAAPRSTVPSGAASVVSEGQISNEKPVATTPVGQSASSTSKHGVKTDESTNLPDPMQALDTASCVSTVVAAVGVQATIPSVPEVYASQNAALQSSSTTNAASSAIKQNQTSTTTGVLKQASVKVDSAAVESVTSASAAQSKTQCGLHADLETHGISSDGTSNTQNASLITGGSHLIEADNLPAPATTLAAHHTASSSAQTDLQLHATNVLDESGMRNVHVIPSGPTQLDVGVLDGTHGWLRIRAELGAGGSVNASLTATALAHESLRAALPEMAKYLGSEAVSVSKLVVHRFAEDSGATAVATEANQQNSGTRGHNAEGREVPDDGGTQNNQSLAIDPNQTSLAPTMNGSGMDREDVAAGEAGPWNRGLSHTLLQPHWSFAAMEGSNGHWLNVSA